MSRSYARPNNKFWVPRYMNLLGVDDENLTAIFKKQLFPNDRPLEYKFFNCKDAEIHCFGKRPSPFSPANSSLPIELDGQVYKSIINFIVYKMFTELTRQTPRDDIEMGLGRQLKNSGVSDSKRQNWILNRGLSYLQRAYWEKARQHPLFLERLLATGDETIIIYMYPYDRFFGVGDKIRDVKRWKENMQESNNCVQYPVSFPLRYSDLRMLPKITQGYNVLGAILMSLRDQLIRGTPINSLGVHVPSMFISPIVAHQGPDVGFSGKRFKYRQNYPDATPTPKRPRMEMDCMNSSTPMSYSICCSFESTPVYPGGDLRPSTPNQDGQTPRRSHRTISEASGHQRMTWTPTTSFDRLHLNSLPASDRRIDEFPTTYSTMNTPEHCEQELFDGEKSRCEQEDLNGGSNIPSSVYASPSIVFSNNYDSLNAPYKTPIQQNYTHSFGSRPRKRLIEPVEDCAEQSRPSSSVLTPDLEDACRLVKELGSQPPASGANGSGKSHHDQDDVQVLSCSNSKSNRPTSKSEPRRSSSKSSHFKKSWSLNSPISSVRLEKNNDASNSIDDHILKDVYHRIKQGEENNVDVFKTPKPFHARSSRSVFKSTVSSDLSKGRSGSLTSRPSTSDSINQFSTPHNYNTTNISENDLLVSPRNQHFEPSPLRDPAQEVERIRNLHRK